MTYRTVLRGLSLAISAALLTASLVRPETVNTRIGTLEFENGYLTGYPTKDTVRKLFEEMDFQRAVQAYLWGLPIVAMAQWQYTHDTQFGVRNGELVLYPEYDEKLGILTANATTPYLVGMADLAKDGPFIVEVPKGATAGMIIDFWQRPITDLGLAGPDQGEGAKYLILPPGHEETNPQGYQVFRSPTTNIFFAYRILDRDPAKGKALMSQIRSYAYSARTNPPQSEFPTPKERWTQVQPRGMTYWERLAEILAREPVHERDRFFIAMLKPLGIEKGKPFKPDDRQQKILTEAALVGKAMAKANTFDKRVEGPFWPGTHWKLALVLDPSQRAKTYDQLEERAAWFYEAVTTSKGMVTKTPGVGQTYLTAYKDKDGDWLDGGNTYRLRVPANPPAMQFWSVTLYDVDTRCLIQNDQKIADRSSHMDLVENADGSVDVYFGPEAPKGFEKNWIPTKPSEGWFTYFRLYAPTEAYFDKSWSLPDIEKGQ